MDGIKAAAHRRIDSNENSRFLQDDDERSPQQLPMAVHPKTPTERNLSKSSVERTRENSAFPICLFTLERPSMMKGVKNIENEFSENISQIRTRFLQLVAEGLTTRISRYPRTRETIGYQRTVPQASGQNRTEAAVLA
jgi:hypothetical protein